MLQQEIDKMNERQLIKDLRDNCKRQAIYYASEVERLDKILAIPLKINNETDKKLQIN